MKKAVVGRSRRAAPRAAKTEVELVGSTPEEFRDYIQREVPRWRDIIKSANIQPD